MFVLAIFQNGLKPGIDLEGGSTLLYEIDTTGMPEYERRAVCEDMIRILRQRIDPSDQMGLVWRPHGVDKIEIQMPLATEETRRLRAEFKEALDVVGSGNINMVKVKEALRRPEGKSQQEYQAAREEQITVLAAGNAGRKVSLDELCVVTDKIEQASSAVVEVRQKIADLTAKAQEGQISESGLDSLKRRWSSLDEPNRVSAVSEMAKKDPALEKVVRDYIDASNQLSVYRNELTSDDGLLVQQNDIIRKLEKSNINLELFEKYLAAAPQRRAQEVKALIDNNPEQEVQIKKIVAAYDKYAGVSGRLDDPEDLKRKLQGSGVLEFRILPSPQDEALTGKINEYQSKLAEFGPSSISASTSDFVWRKVRDSKNFRADNSVVLGNYGEDTYVLASNRKEDTLVGSGDKTWKLKGSRPDQDQYGAPAVSFQFNNPGAELFYTLTKNNKDKPLCILLDGEAISAPNINNAIHGSGIITGSFSYKETVELSDKLKAGSLPAALSKEPIAENNIGPTLGKDNLQAGMRSAIWGMIAVVVFMLIYYRFAGLLADFALMMNVLFVLGTLAFMRSTFTLPGIAGLILTVGMAVDANVLIFERIREELKGGSSLRIAIKNGYGRAFWTIFDSNLTTFLIALVLWVLASEEIKGFALVLMIGIVSSMFTALFITRMIFDWMVDLEKLGNKLTMLHWLSNVNFKWMSYKPVFWTVSGVVVLLCWVMFISRQSDKNSMYSIEFIGGTSIQVKLVEDKVADLLNEQQQVLPIAEKGLVLRGIIEERIQKATSDDGIKASRVQQVGPVANLEYEIITPATNKVTVNITPGEGDSTTVAEVKAKFDAVAAEMHDKRLADNIFTENAGVITLQTSQTSVAQVKKAIERSMPNSKYGEPVADNIVGDAVIAAIGEQLDIMEDLVPSNIQTFVINEELISRKPYLSSYSGGLLLTADFAPGKNDTLASIKDRFERTRIRSDFDEYKYYASEFFAPDNVGADKSLGGIEMVTRSDEVVNGISSDEQWNAFVLNEQGRFAKALNLKTSFTRMTQIDPSVGSKAMTMAVIAIIVSLMVIVVYVWVRFGNVRYGIAAVVALIHDVSIALGLLAASAWLAGTPIGSMLLISDFKIDLPVIAALLTLIGYSINDTIVIFDRIRENRGKKTVLTRDMIDGSINQAMSRTILTSGTTLLVVVVMYFFGGIGLRPFNFVLLFGIIVGTYSSVGVAAPILCGAVDIEPEELDEGPVSEGVPMN